MNYPAGNSNWAWTWMGFYAPLTYNEEHVKKYNKFLNCFGLFSGIGEFDYWDRHEIHKLSNNEKLELIKLLLSDNKNDTRYNMHDYVGINFDNMTINKNIYEFGNPSHFFDQANQETTDQIDNNNILTKIVKSLEDCLTWMDDLRESGDAGFWEWDDDEYTKAVSILHEYRNMLSL